MKYIQSLLAQPFLQGTFLFTSLSFLASFFSYVFNFLLAHVVSPAQYGEYSTSISYFSLFSVPFGAMSLILMTKIGQISQKKREEYVVAVEHSLYSSLTKNLLIILIGGFCVGAVLAWGSRLHLSSVIFVLALTAMTFFITIYVSFFQAKKQFLFAGLFLCLLGIFKMIVGGVSAVMDDELWELYMLLILAHVVLILFAKWYLNHEKKTTKTQITLPGFLTLIQRKSFYLPVLTFLGLVGLVSVDMMIVKRFFAASDVGAYAAISLLGRIILYISLPLTTVAFSFFTDRDTTHQSNAVLWTSFGLIILLGCVSVIGYSLFPAMVVKVIFGEQYLSISSVVWLAGIYGSVYSLATLLGQYWVAQHHPISMASIICAGIQAILLLLKHDSFVMVLSISITCSTVLFIIYLSALINRQRRVYASA